MWEAFANSQRACAEPKAEERRLGPFFGWRFQLEHSLVFSCPQTVIYTIGSPDSPAFGLKLNCTPSFPGFLACRRQNRRRVSLYNGVNQFFLINIFIYTKSVCFSGKPWHQLSLSRDTRSEIICIYICSVSFFSSRKHTVQEAWPVVSSPVHAMNWLCSPRQVTEPSHLLHLRKEESDVRSFHTSLKK